MPEEQSTSQPAPSAVVARGISVTGPWGPVIGPLDLDIDAGGVVALIGPPGSGRTALLMILAGRMKPSSGSVTVFGHTRARDIFGVSALAGIDELDSVFESVTVRDLITEQSRWNAHWYRLIRRAGEDELDALCRPVFGDLPLPRLDEYVDELSELDGLLLRIALANTERPPLLVVGGIDQVASDRNREKLVRRLVELGEHQTVITATVNDVPPEWRIRAQPIAEHLERAELMGQGQTCRTQAQKGDD